MRHGSAVRCARFSPDGHRVVTASGDGTARLWDVETGEELGEMEHEAWVNWAEFSPNGHWVATGCDDGTARLWDADTGKALGDAFRHADAVLAVEFSPDVFAQSRRPSGRSRAA